MRQSHWDSVDMDIVELGEPGGQERLLERADGDDALRNSVQRNQFGEEVRKKHFRWDNPHVRSCWGGENLGRIKGSCKKQPVSVAEAETQWVGVQVTWWRWQGPDLALS